LEQTGERLDLIEIKSSPRDARQAARFMRRNTKELLLATVPFTTEDSSRSVRATAISFTALALSIVGSAMPLSFFARAACSILEGMLIVRCFGLYHDALHGALLRESGAARWLFAVFGVLVLTPPRVWRQTHNYHHAHTAQLVGSQVGSFATVNMAMWRQMGPWKR
jgi:omega-6 fatty acid desaturase (delta-12 desaturase)